MRLLIYILILSTFYSIAQSNEQITYNREYNNILYLCKESWKALKGGNVSSIKIYNRDGETVKSFTFKTIKSQRVPYMDKIISSLYNLDEDIIRIKIDSKIIDISNNNLKIDYNYSVFNCINDHAEYCKNQFDVTHEQGITSYEDRLVNYNIRAIGAVAENCAKTYGMGTIRMDIRRVIKVFYLNKYISKHWDQFMREDFKVYSSVMVKGDDMYVYSVTLFSQNKTTTNSFSE